MSDQTVPRSHQFEPDDLVADELVTLAEQGADTSDLERWAQATTGTLMGARARARAFYELAAEARTLPSFGFVEPSSLSGIRAEAADLAPSCDGQVSEYEDRVLAAWQGRAAGCCLGKPVEGTWWTRTRLREYLERCGAYPLDDYVPGDGLLPPDAERHPSWDVATRGRVQGMPRDDDIDYTILNLHLLEGPGAGFSSQDVAWEWLHHLPLGLTYTAERVTYRNLAAGLAPDAAGGVHNPYREWIGALIRADVFGYVLPGRPHDSAELAYRDAWLSHRRNGIYGEMWAAALVSAAFACNSAEQAVLVALAEVPARSRTAHYVRQVVEIFRLARPWEQAMELIESELGSYSWIHTVNNAAALAAALLWGEGDFGRTIGLAVEAALDTDSIGATAGSVFGALHGTKAIDGHWLAPLGERIHTAVVGEQAGSFRSFAERTIRVAEALA